MTDAEILLLPGLGFTGRLFERLRVPGRRLRVLEWIPPIPGETLEAYAVRWFGKRDEDVVPPILVAHSFGGIVAQALAPRTRLAGIVLVSSIKARAENPLPFRLVAPLRLHRLFTKKATLRTLALWGGRFGYPRGPQRDLFRAMVEVQDDRFLQWALHELSRWPGPPAHTTAIEHLHGTADRTFPMRRIREPVTRVTGGTHLMVWDRADEVSAAVGQAIGRIERG